MLCIGIYMYVLIGFLNCVSFVSTVSNKFVWKRVHYKACFANNLIIAYYKPLYLKRKHKRSISIKLTNGIIDWEIFPRG